MTPSPYARAAQQIFACQSVEPAELTSPLQRENPIGHGKETSGVFPISDGMFGRSAPDNHLLQPMKQRGSQPLKTPHVSCPWAEDIVQALSECRFKGFPSNTLRVQRAG